jgi:5-methylcytosine-specific restriction endonuclease McrA
MSNQRNNESKIIARRSCNIYSNQKRRARQQGIALDYSPKQFRALAEQQVGRACPYCCEGLTAKNFSADHRQPVSRSGKHEIDNLVICCERCNQTKGMMNDLEFIDLLNCLDHFPPNVRRDVLARLRAGGRWFRN